MKIEFEKIEELKELSRTGRSVCTIALAEEILQENPEHFYATVKLGIALASVQRFSDAVELLEKLEKGVSTQEQSYSVFATMGFVLYQYGKFDYAIDWYRKAFKQGNPRSIDLEFYADCLVKQGRYSDAIESLAEWNYNQEKSSFNNLLGVAYRALGQYEDALNYFRKAVDLGDEEEEAAEAVEDLLMLKKRGYDSE